MLKALVNLNDAADTQSSRYYSKRWLGIRMQLPPAEANEEYPACFLRLEVKKRQRVVESYGS
jgi:hypothetical protein